MAADPSVSPADTPAVRIRRDASHLLRSVVTWGGVKEIIGDDLYRRSLLALRSLEVTPDELLTERAALLAVGERDRAEIAELRLMLKDAEADVDAGERDRQQIARLTEENRNLRNEIARSKVRGVCSCGHSAKDHRFPMDGGTGWCERHNCGCAEFTQVAAVLAGEEDARP